MENKIYVTMSNVKVIYVGEKTGTAKSTGKPYSIKQVQVEQTRRDGLRTLHLMTVPQFNVTPISVGDTIDAEIAVRSVSGGAMYLDLTDHRPSSAVAEKPPLKAVAGGGK